MTADFITSISFDTFSVELVIADSATLSLSRAYTDSEITALSLGTASQNNTEDFATAAQGALADSSVQSVTSTDNHIVVDNTDAINPVLSFQLVDNENLLTDDELAIVQATSGENTGDQDLSGLLPNSHLIDYTHGDIAHINRSALDNVTNVNSGDEVHVGLTEPTGTEEIWIKTDELGTPLTASQVDFVPTVDLLSTNVQAAIAEVVEMIGDGGITIHNDLTGRSTDNAHPISAITGLQTALDAKALIVNQGAYPEVITSASSGTITLSVNTFTNFSTQLTDVHTITITQGAILSDFSNEWIAMFETGITAPTITFTPPVGVTYKWVGGTAIPVLASRVYTLSVLKKTATLYSINLIG
jgi:hypothetical protein